MNIIILNDLIVVAENQCRSVHVSVPVNITKSSLLYNIQLCYELYYRYVYGITGMYMVLQVCVGKNLLNYQFVLYLF